MNEEEKREPESGEKRDGGQRIELQTAESAPGSEYRDTMEALRQAENGMPAFGGSYDAEISRLYDRIVNRESFRYDAGSDPLYGAYRDRYVREGKLAMRDSMGQSAALTGGYGSSYSQAVGQQQYGEYLEKLGNVMPKLYSAAYSRYKSEGDRLGEQYAMAVSRDSAEYARYRDRLGDAREQQELQYEMEQRSYDRQQKSFQTLMSLISATGYEASSGDLERSGMSQEQADALRNEFLRKNGLLGGYGGSSGGSVWYGSSGKEQKKKNVKNPKEASKAAENVKGESSGDKNRRKW